MTPNIDPISPPESQPTYPVNYGRARVASLIYLVNPVTAQSALSEISMHPFRVGKHALLSVAWFDYESSDFGPYRELSIGVVADTDPNVFRTAVSALTNRFFTLGTFVLALPVTNTEAAVAGVQHLGLPKTKVELPLTWSKGVLDATVVDQSSRILSMRIPLGIGPRPKVPALTIYSVNGGQLLRTRVETDFRPEIDLVGRPRLSVEERSHPLSQLLSRFKLESAPCVGIAHGVISSAKLLAPIPVPTAALR
jgi:hypothetical protein